MVTEREMGTPVDRAIRVLILEDHPIVCEGLTMLLEHEGIRVCGQAADCEGALRRFDETAPDAVIVDLSLGEESGLDAIRALLLRRPELAILVLSMHEDANRVQQSFASGAMGYVSKREAAEQLTRAIREVLAGRRYLSPRAARCLAERLAARPSGAGAECLSDQERQVYEALGDGEPTGEIAARLGISPKTVESYYDRILAKLGLRSMRELRKYAIGHKVRS